MDTPITLFLILVTSVVSIAAFGNREIFDKLKLNPFMVLQRKEWGRVLGHGLLHADWMHLIINMYVLYSFGGAIEQVFDMISRYGKFWYVIMYVLSVVAATLPALYKHRNSHSYNAVGASGAVSAVAFASILIMPTSKISFVFLPFLQIPAYIFGFLYLVYSYFMAKRAAGNVAHDAHFAGAVFGFLFPLIIEPSLIQRFFVQIVGG